MRALRVLTFTSLFPSAARPRHGIFVETRLRQLLCHAPVEARVVAPVPLFPWRSPIFGRYAEFAATRRSEHRAGGIEVVYPRYVMLPGVGVRFQPESMALVSARAIKRLQGEGFHPDVIDAHYLYPDGVAASLLSARFGIPYTLTARGTDVNVLARLPGISARIRTAMAGAAAVITVSPGLRDSLLEIDPSVRNVSVLRNGVDTELFFPEATDAAREAFGLGSAPLMLSVGNLVPEKGQLLAIEALTLLPGWELAIVGDGPQASSLKAAAQTLGVADRVRFMAVVPQARLRLLYAAADVLALTSLREGWPNVVLEAMACGTPVVATAVGAVGEMITKVGVGRIVQGRSALDFAAAITDTVKTRVSAAALRSHASSFDWRSIVLDQFELLYGATRLKGVSAEAASPSPLHISQRERC
ncbi:glycosyltransferase [uncultured Piscinibacter sp.]|uniref:glycosyltransferase n=1 Tax=uncultured Piscinibacter sp. TaxID=1131835 RepID=UPI00262FB43C|nr:glycosyltransferase [uncultured Piscinibacter sp.]